MKQYLLIAFSLINFLVFAQPANDNCSGAISLGTLGTPGNCGSGVQSGAITTLSTTNVGATPEVPFSNLAGCLINNVNDQANSVWYTFVCPPKGFGVIISVTGGGAALANPAISLYSGSCATFTGVDCITGAGGTATLNVGSGMIPGTTYTIQINGNNGQSGPFTLSANSYQDCSDCLRQATLTVNPLPVNGTYQPGQVVQFCFHIDQWLQISNNWLHGVQLTFGAGWDQSTLVATPPTTDLNYLPPSHWFYFPNGIGVVNGVNWGPGFYFDGPTDGIAGNNFGDGVAQGATPTLFSPIPATEWLFCWTIAVNNVCNPGGSLAVDVFTSGDGESGSWSSAGCADDPASSFSALTACCPPNMTSTATCPSASTGTATATVVPGTEPTATFLWVPGGQTTSTATGLTPGTYTVTMTDGNGCQASNTVVVPVSTLPIINAGPDVTICAGQSTTLAGTLTNSSTPTTFTNSTSIVIPDNNATGITSTINVSGISPTTVGANPIVSVCLNITHTWDEDLDIFLVCPGGTQIELSTDNGGSGDNYTNTCFYPTGIAITAGTAPFTGSYTPEQLFTLLNACNVNGTWSLIVKDDTGGDVGTLSNWSITFNNTPTSTFTWSPIAGMINPLTLTPTVSPATTTIYTLTGTGAGGCTVTDQVTVNVSPLPTVGAGNDQTVCSNTAVTLTGSGASNYTWNNGVTNGVAFTPAATATYTVTGTSIAGCINTDQVTVTVNPIPVVSAGPDVSICLGSSTTLTATGATSYSWSPGGQLTAAITVSPVVTTTYTVTGTSLGCIASDAVTVTILANAPINAGLDVAICLGASTTLSATGGITYTWDNGLGLGNNLTVSPVVTTTYTVVGTNLGGCVGTDAMTVTVNPNPAPIITGPSTYCVGNFALLATTTPFTTYSWSTGAITPTINATQVDSPVSVTVTNAFGCQTTSSVFLVSENNLITVNSTITICQGQSSLIHGINETTAGVYSLTTILASGCDSVSNVTLVVNPLPIVNAGIDQVFCGVTNTILNGNGATTYTWTNGVLNGISFSPPIGTLTYTVIGTSASGCISSDQVDVTVNPLPIVSTGPDQSVCAGIAVTLSGSGATTYSWNNGITDGVAFIPVSTTTYTVTGTSSDGCISTDQVIVTVNPIPTVFAGNDVSTCANQTVTLTGSGAATYSWNNGITNGIAFNPPAGTTTYVVTGTSAAGCINTDQVNVTLDLIPVVTFTPDITFGCVPLTVNFTNTTPNSADCVWTMSDGTVLTGCGTVTNTFTQAGCYDITLTTTLTNGCTSSFTAIDLICAEESPIASFIPSASIISEMNPMVNFINTTAGAINYLWNFGDNSPTSILINPSHDYSSNAIGSYIVTLIAYSPSGCVDTAYSTIQIYEELIFYIPNTFTPDDDDYNQEFKPIFTSGYDPYDYTLLIFNRWGEIIFESHNTEIGWNGTYGSNHEIDLVQDGTYTWKIEFKTTRNDERIMRVGHINILR